MGGVRSKHLAQVSLAEDQHPVGDLGSDGQHEAFGEAVRAWTPMRRPSGAVWMTPERGGLGLGTGMPATVTPAPPSRCWVTICRGSIR
jgi:hypothetical protein